MLCSTAIRKVTMRSFLHTEVTGLRSNKFFLDIALESGLLPLACGNPDSGHLRHMRCSVPREGS